MKFKSKPHDLLKTLITVVVATLPITGVYNSIIPSVDLGTLLFIIIGLIMLVSDSTIQLTYDSRSVLFVYLLIFSPISIVIFHFTGDTSNYPSYVTALLRWGKLIALLLVLTLRGIRNRISIENIISSCRTVVFISTAFVVLQQLSHTILGMTINNPFLNFATYEAYQNGKYSMFASASLFRPSAFFLEPSHMAQYLLFYLCFVLFASKGQEKRISNTVITLIGILSTGSGIGIVVSVSLLILFSINKMKKNIVKGGLTLLSFAVIIFLFSEMTYIENVLDRVFSHGSIYGNVIQSRIGNGYEIFWNLPLIAQIFGTGFGNVQVGEYLNGAAYVLNTMGIVGCLILIMFFYKQFQNSTSWKKVVIVCYFALLFAAQMFTASWIVFILCVSSNMQDEINVHSTKIKANIRGSSTT